MGNGGRPARKPDNSSHLWADCLDHCGSLDVSQPYVFPRPVTGIALPFYAERKQTASGSDSELTPRSPQHLLTIDILWTVTCTVTPTWSGPRHRSRGKLSSSESCLGEKQSKIVSNRDSPCIWCTDFRVKAKRKLRLWCWIDNGMQGKIITQKKS
jgi:hypothetical protein